MEENTTLKLLKIIAASEHPLPIHEIREQTALANTTLNRLLNQLMKESYVSRAGRGRYTGGPALFHLGSAAVNNSLSSRYRPLIEDLAERTGLNSEIYSLGAQGPVMLFWIQGRSEFRVRMYPGFRLAAVQHPAVAFFLNRNPGRLCWGKPASPVLPDGRPSGEWIASAVEGEVLFDRGLTRPELTRCAVLIPGEDLVVSLSGLTSEFPTDRDALAAVLLGAVDPRNDTDL